MQKCLLFKNQNMAASNLFQISFVNPKNTDFISRHSPPICTFEFTPYFLPHYTFVITTCQQYWFCWSVNNTFCIFTKFSVNSATVLAIVGFSIFSVCVSATFTKMLFFNLCSTVFKLIQHQRKFQAN